MAYFIEEKRSANYSESSGSITTTTELELISDTMMSLQQVHAAVRTWCKQHATDFGGRKNIGVNISTDEDGLGTVWHIQVQYSTREKSAETSEYPQQPVEVSENFSTSGGQAHITQGYSQTRVAVSGFSAPDLGGGIGWNGDSFDGCDVVRPAFSFSISKRYTSDQITASQKTSWAEKTGCVNSDIFNGFDPGTVLFDGVSGQMVVEYGDDTVVISGKTYLAAHIYYDCTFSFRCQPNQPNYGIAGVTISKGGWDHVSVLRETRDDATTGKTIQYPIAAYCTTVYKSTPFSGIVF